MQRIVLLSVIIIAVLAACTGAPENSASLATAPAIATPANPDPIPTDVATIPMPTEADTQQAASAFDGELAFGHLEQQMRYSDRWPGTANHAVTGDYIVDVLTETGWRVEEQLFEYKQVPGRNIIGRANEGVGPVIILGAHYDTRRIADQTPGAAAQNLSVPGAVDGASGVAVLLELARALNRDDVPNEIWLAFFDLEDNGSGGLPGWEWIVGSTYMADNLTIAPEAVVVVDMVGDADQQLYYDGNSDPALRETLWQVAAELGYQQAFIPQIKHTMIDDHLPFAQKGIPAVDIIDFDYPYWHTVDDTIDKASADSLHRVGRTLEVWLEQVLEDQSP